MFLLSIQLRRRSVSVLRMLLLLHLPVMLLLHLLRARLWSPVDVRLHTRLNRRGLLQPTRSGGSSYIRRTQHSYS